MSPTSLTIALLVFLSCPVLSMALNVTATASSEIDAAGLVASKTVDGDTGTFWSSNASASPDRTEWIEFLFDRPIVLSRVTLTPRVSGYGFPDEYRIEYGYDDAGAIRFPVAGWEFTGAAGTETPVVLDAPGHIVVRRLRITATRLGADDFGNFYFQLAEAAFEESADTDLPFETSVGGDFDARLNQMWFTYGSISDGTSAVFDFGNEPSYHEWMALKYAWSATTASKFQTLINQRLLPWGQSADGYMWSWASQEKWPTGDGSFHQDNNPKHILALWRAWAWTRDDALFDRIDTTIITAPTAPSRPDVSFGRTLRQKAREAMDFLIDEQQGALGGIIIQDNGMGSDGTVDGDPTNYWDNLRYGYLNAYDSIYYTACLEAMAQLEDLWGDGARAAQLRTWRETARADYVDKFWDPALGRFIATIDKNGERWDFGLTFHNLEALAYGLGDQQKADAILDWLDGARIIPGETSTGADIYAFGWAPRANTVAVETIGPPYWWYSINGAIPVDTAAARYGNHLENGGAIFYTSYYDLMARLRWRGPDDALVRLTGILDEFQSDQLRRDPAEPGSAPWKFGIIGEFPESGLVPCALVYGFAGVEANAAGLAVHPRLPAAWSHLTVRQIAYAGRTLDLRVEDTQVTLTNRAESADSLYLNGAEVAPGATASQPIDAGGSALITTSRVQQGTVWRMLEE